MHLAIKPVKHAKSKYNDYTLLGVVFMSTQAKRFVCSYLIRLKDDQYVDTRG